METHLYITSNGHYRCYPSPNITLMKKLSPTLQKGRKHLLLPLLRHHIKTSIVKPSPNPSVSLCFLTPEIWEKDSLRENMCILEDNWWTFQKWINSCDVLWIVKKYLICAKLLIGYRTRVRFICIEHFSCQDSKIVYRKYSRY